MQELANNLNLDIDFSNLSDNELMKLLEKKITNLRWEDFI